MDKSLLQNLSGVVKLLLDLLITFVVFTVVFFVGLVIGSALFHIPVKEFITNAGNLQDISALKYLAFLQSIGLFLIPAYVISWFFSRPKRFFGLDRTPSLAVAGLIILVMLVSQLVVNYLAFVNNAIHFPEPLDTILRNMEEQTMMLTRRLLSTTSIGGFLVNVFIIALIPAMGEEFFFRGVIQRHLQESFRNYHIAVITAAFIFAFVHFEFFTFLPRFFLGLILGYLYVWQRNIWASILAHFTNNFLGVVIYFYALRKGMDISHLENPQHTSVLLFLLGLILVILFLVKIKELSNDRS